MEDLTLLFSLIAIILSLASVILITIRIGIGLGLEFVERKEIREMKKKVDDELNKEWIAKLQDFLKREFEKPGEATEETTIKEVVELGEATRHTQIASTLLKVLSKMIFDIVKLVIAIIVGAIIFTLLVWGAVSFTELTNTLGGLALAVLLFLVTIIVAMRKMIKSYVSLRSQFYELSETPSLSKAKNVMDELEERELIYA